MEAGSETTKWRGTHWTERDVRGSKKERKREREREKETEIVSNEWLQKKQVEASASERGDDGRRSERELVNEDKRDKDGNRGEKEK